MAIFKMTYTGSSYVQAALAGIKKGVQSTIVRAALTKAARPIAKDAKRRAPSRKRGKKDGPSGLLKKSIGFKVKRIKKTDVLVAIIGARREVMGFVGKQKRVPANYAHLIEYGHRVATGGVLERIQKPGWTPELVWNTRLKTMVYKHGAPKRNSPSARIGKQTGYVKAQPFMRPAWDAGRRQAERTIVEEVRAGIKRITAKYAVKGKSIYA